MATPNTPPMLRRVSRTHPCPTCGHADWCEVRDDGAVHCMRTESDKPCSARGGGWWHDLPKGGAPAKTVADSWSNTRNRTGASPVYRASAALLDSVYRSILGASPLSTDHRSYLESCGIGHDQLWHYGTYTALGDAVAAFDADDLLCIPGFYLGASGDVVCALKPGSLLIGVADMHTRIVGMQIRRPDGGYHWLSSTKYNGPGSGAPPYVAQGGNTRQEQVWITEGVKKADVLMARCDYVCVALAGHANQSGLDDVLSELRDSGTMQIVIAFDEDADPHTATLVQTSRERLSRLAFGLGLAVRWARWDGDAGKGIDDLLLAGHYPDIQIITPGDVPDPNGGSGGFYDDFGRKAEALMESGVPDRELRAWMGAAVVLRTTKTTSLKSVPMKNVARKMGLTRMYASEKTAAREASYRLVDIAERGLLRRDLKRDADGHSHNFMALGDFDGTINALGAAALIGAESASSRLKAEAARKRHCPHCGSDALEPVVMCKACHWHGPESALLDSEPLPAPGVLDASPSAPGTAGGDGVAPGAHTTPKSRVPNRYLDSLSINDNSIRNDLGGLEGSGAINPPSVIYRGTESVPTPAKRVGSGDGALGSSWQASVWEDHDDAYWDALYPPIDGSSPRLDSL